MSNDTSQRLAEHCIWVAGAGLHARTLLPLLPSLRYSTINTTLASLSFFFHKKAQFFRLISLLLDTNRRLQAEGFIVLEDHRERLWYTGPRKPLSTLAAAHDANDQALCNSSYNNSMTKKSSRPANTSTTTAHLKTSLRNLNAQSTPHTHKPPLLSHTALLSQT